MKNLRIRRNPLQDRISRHSAGSFLLLALMMICTSSSIYAQNPVPVLTSMFPSSATVGSGPMQLTINGSSFVSTSVVQWNGTDRQTTVFDSTRLFANLTASDLLLPGTAAVTVRTPAPGGGTSSALTFTINPATPTILSLSPASTAAGSASFSLTVNGSDFSSAAVVRWNGADKTTSFVNTSTLVATIPAADVATAGTAAITVFTPPGTISNAVTFTITVPVALPSKVYFPHFVMGGGYDTLVSIVNVGDDTASGTMSFTDKEGRPLIVSYAEPSGGLESGIPQNEALGTAVPINLLSGASKTLLLQDPSLGPTFIIGWIVLDSTGGVLSSVANFRYRQGTTLRTSAGVIQSQAASVATIPLSNSAAEESYMGFAVANPNSEEIRIKISIVGEDGSIVDSILHPELNPLLPGKQVARFIHEYKAYLVNMKGSMVLEAQGGKTFAAVALREQQKILSAVPVANRKSYRVPF